MIQPVVHLRRPDMQSWDGWVHVNPFTTTNEIGVAMIFNPIDTAIDTIINIPLYYTGATDVVKVVVDGNTANTMTVNRDYSINLRITMPARSIHTVVVYNVSDT